MHRIPLALLWEMSVKGRWPLPGFFLLGNLMPMFIYTALSQLAVDYDDPALLNMHIIFLPLVMFQCAIGIVAAQGTLSRLYATPISTSMLVAWHGMSGGLLLAMEIAVALWLQNLLFGFSYPIAGPSLFAATAWMAAQPLVCTSHRTISSFCVIASPSVLLFLWLHSRYGSWFAQPTHYWSPVSIADACTLLAVATVFHFVTVTVVKRDRCGERMPSLNGWKWLVQKWEARGRSALIPDRPFASLEEAQRWYEWQPKGIAFPVIVLLAVSAGVVATVARIVALGDAETNLRDLHEGLLGGGGILSIIAGIAGLLVGSTATGKTQRHREVTIRDLADQTEFERMGDFLATRPFDNATFAHAILSTAARSTIIAWGFWATVLAAVFVARLFAGGAWEPILPAEVRYWYLPLTLLGVWVVMTNISTVTMTGRGSKFIFTGVISGVALLVVSSIARSGASQATEALVVPFLWSISVLVVAGTVWAFKIATERNMVTMSLLMKLTFAAVLVTAVAVALKPADMHNVGYMLIVAFASLTILPFATAPLGIAWNRHR